MRELSIFAEMPLQRLESLGFHPTVIGYPDGAVLYREGEVASAAFTLRTGLVKITKSLPNGRSQIIRVLHPGDLLGLDCFAGGDYHHNAIALIESEVCRLPIKELDALRQSDPTIDRAIMLRWSKVLRTTENLTVELGTKKAAERLASFLLDWCKTPDGEGWNDLPLSRLELGELLGLTIETVSRFLSDWRKNALIAEQNHRIRILDGKALREVACASGAC